MKTEIHLPWRALKAASLFASTDETRYIIQGIHIAMHKGHLVMVATDGRRMIVMRIQEDNDLPAGFALTFAVPHALLDLPDHTGFTLRCVIGEDGKQITLFCYDLGYVVPILDGKYPQWQEILPKLANPQPQACVAYSGEMMRDLVEGIEVFTGQPGVVVWAPDAVDGCGPMYARPDRAGYHDCFAILMPRSKPKSADQGPLPFFLKEILEA